MVFLSFLPLSLTSVFHLLPEHFYSDFYSFDPLAMMWTNLTSSLIGPRIPARCGHGFVASSGSLFVFDGSGEIGCYLELFLQMFAIFCLSQKAIPCCKLHDKCHPKCPVYVCRNIWGGLPA